MPAKRQTKSVENVAKKSPRKPPGSAHGTDAKLLLKLYREMMLIRRFEERAGQLYGMGLIGGFCHLYIDRKSVV